MGELAAFADRQTGQVDSGNDDKAGADRIYTVCEEQNAAAAAELKNKRGWR